MLYILVHPSVSGEVNMLPSKGDKTKDFENTDKFVANQNLLYFNLNHDFPKPNQMVFVFNLTRFWVNFGSSIL